MFRKLQLSYVVVVAGISLAVSTGKFEAQSCCMPGCCKVNYCEPESQGQDGKGWFCTSRTCSEWAPTGSTPAPGSAVGKYFYTGGAFINVPAIRSAPEEV